MSEPNNSTNLLTVLRRVVRRDPTLAREDFVVAAVLSTLPFVVIVLGLTTLLGVDTHEFDVWVVTNFKNFF